MIQDVSDQLFQKFSSSMRRELEEAFEQAFQIQAPVLVHVKTIKGRGYAPAEQGADSGSQQYPFGGQS